MGSDSISTHFFMEVAEPITIIGIQLKKVGFMHNPIVEEICIAY